VTPIRKGGVDDAQGSGILAGRAVEKRRRAVLRIVRGPNGDDCQRDADILARWR